ncbi:hypothetical protein M2283_009585 [Streptomyces pseudovenezuelae]|uniref:Uncharacterized protein n=1 Tax=Streptomyces pseudovenezuelae TaxID=67350 RepID=A0ABT6M2K5_9ACTN|nr:hypothetical protein [Streptomyces pseudovenezuelae]
MSCGTRVQDVGPGDPDGARLLRSSLWDQLLTSGVLRTAGDANCSAACGSAALRQPAPSPVLRLLWLGTPLPNLPVRASAADAFTEVLLTDFHCWVPRTALTGTATASTAVLLTAAPDHCGPPGPVASPVAVLQPLWLRNSTTAPSCVLLPGSSCLPGPAVSLGYERNHNHATAMMSTPTNTDFRAFGREVAALGRSADVGDSPRHPGPQATAHRGAAHRACLEVTGCRSASTVIRSPLR